jgi:hypothetical protein
LRWNNRRRHYLMIDRSVRKVVLPKANFMKPWIRRESLRDRAIGGWIPIIPAHHSNADRNATSSREYRSAIHEKSLTYRWSNRKCRSEYIRSDMYALDRNEWKTILPYKALYFLCAMRVPCVHNRNIFRKIHKAKCLLHLPKIVIFFLLKISYTLEARH